jgi:hypothetical protein
LHTFRGGSTWARQAASPAEAKGAWSQAVFQVDDSPRYEALGRWEHQGNLSVWTSARAWRPLPRREFSVRDDYDVLQGTHRIALTPTGWLHEQQNWKRAAGVRSSPEGAPAEPVYVAAEFGLDRYERITSPAMTPADDYWRKTGAYWALVRAAWRDLFKRNERVTLKAEVAGKKLFQHHFEYAERLEAGQPFVPAEAARQIADTLESFLEKGS